MIVSLFRRSNANNARIVDALYQHIIGKARDPLLYADLGIPDTPLGRYESLSAHMIAFLHRTRGGEAAIEALAQDVLDEFFKDVDHSIRELGIGDAGVPKRMKKLGRMFYGRMGPYWQAFDGGYRDAFCEALGRNMRPDDPDGLEAGSIADHLLAFHARLMATPDDAILSGRLEDSAPTGDRDE